ncbi:hypothetical protein BL253_27970 [Pseudofrankia asymbiotica]|uniref:DUF3846 domain-containing protein n=1 Tax=Pseudofrankia asymbiotica TaxID=1834516 RepID=A0A1V2I3U6_9ACTN|nr:hypothetical protein BL253_27970 [Pseudofrankia asymbiotica]
MLPTDPLLPVRVLDHDETDPRAAQALVGGLIQPVTLSGAASRLYVNLHGKDFGLPPNGRATLLTWMYAPELRGHHDIAGGAFLTGAFDTDAPADLVALLTGAVPARVQTRSHRRPDRWITVSQTVPTVYGEPFDAYATALLALNNPHTLDARVIPRQ